jgi:hypothetical protein
MAGLRLGLWVLLAAVGTTGLAAFVRPGQTAKTTSATAAASPSAGVPKSGSPEPHRTRPRGFVGEVVAVSAAESSFTARETLNDGSPKTTTFRTTPQTRITCGKDPCALSDVKANDHVTVKYADAASGERRALTVRVTPAAKPKTPK